MRGGCGHFVGAFWANSVRVQEAPGRIVRDLIAKTLEAGAEYEEWYRYDPAQTCVALREKKSYRAGRRDPLADWAP